MSERPSWFNISVAAVGTVITVAKTVMEYNRFRRDQESLEYTRNLQREAWRKVMSGELAEAKISDMHLRAPERGASKGARAAMSDDSGESGEA